MKAYTGDGAYLFASYAHKDWDRIAPFIEKLQCECNVWYDEGITPGREWAAEIYKRLTGCSAFLYIVTENSLNSSNCQDEIAAARDLDKPFVNVLAENGVLPDLFRFRYGRFQHFSLYEYEPAAGAAALMEKCADILADCRNGSAEQSVPAAETDACAVPGGIVRFDDYIETIRAGKPMEFSIGAGDGPVLYDLSDAPHLLIAGAPGKGKTNFICTTVLSLLLKNSPAQLQLVLADGIGYVCRIFRMTNCARIAKRCAGNINDIKKALGVKGFYLSFAEENIHCAYPYLRR